MAFLHGKGTYVYYGSTDLRSYLASISMAPTRDTADTTTFASGGDKESIAGQRSATISAAGYRDVDKTALDGVLDANNGVLTWSPGAGSAIGNTAFLVPVLSTSLVTSSPLGGVVALGWEATASGGIGYGQILHPLGEDTNTTTGSSKDDAAATTSGWMAHLHVTAVDGGSWVIKLEDSANNSAWSDVTSGAFTAATGATSQRLISASGATLRRYLKYTATRTGGSGGDGITFALAYARNGVSDAA